MHDFAPKRLMALASGALVIMAAIWLASSTTNHDTAPRPQVAQVLATRLHLTPAVTPTNTVSPTATLTPSPAPTVTSIPGWSKFMGGGVEIWLPNSFVGGDWSREHEELSRKVKELGPAFERDIQGIRKTASATTFLYAVDAESSSSGSVASMRIVRFESVVQPEFLLLPANDVIYGNGTVTGFPPGPEPVRLGRYEAYRMLLYERPDKRVIRLFYWIKHYNVFWIVIFATPATEFAQRFPVFERSMSSFSILPMTETGSTPTAIQSSLPRNNSPLRAQDIALVDERQLTQDAWESFRWSPDGSRILLSRPEFKPDGIAKDGPLAVLDVQTRELNIPSRSGLDPVWSPDGTAIVFSSTNPVVGMREYWLYSVSQPRLLQVPPLPGAPLMWLKDGRLVCRENDGLWTVRLDLTSTLTPTAEGISMTDVQKFLSFEARDGRHWGFPAPDGSAIVLNDDETRQMWMVQPDGSRVEFEQPRGSIGTCCAWAPDRSYFAFFSPQPEFGIYVVDRKGNHRTLVLPKSELGEGFFISMSISPDAQVIAFEGSPQGAGAPFDNTQIYLVNRDGRGLRQLTSDKLKPHRWLQWSPDSRSIAFQREGQVWVAELRTERAP